MVKLIRTGLALGHVIECFDNTLYGFFSLILAPVFFPATDEATTVLASFGAFAAGFITKPLGALLFGIWGDATNRNSPLIASIALIGIPTFVIGLLPSYDTIGILAPILLITCRLFQGIFFGGEFAGAHVYIYETAQQKDLGKNTGFFIASGVMGAIMATFTGFITTLQMLPTWSWRIPFIAGGILALLSFHLRRKMDHLPAHPHHHMPYIASLSLLFSKYKKTIMFAFLLSGLTTIPLNLTTVYANQIFHQLGLTPAQSMALDGLGMTINALFLIFSGQLSDKIGFVKTIEWGIYANILLAFPAFWFLENSSGNSVNIFAFIFLLMAAGTIVNGCAFPYMASLFPPSCRYSGLAISYTTGIATLSGTVPLMATLISNYCQSVHGVAWYLILISMLTLTAHRFLILNSTRLQPHFSKASI
jgi:MHS family proline/betaine transporter-like MFS transporter